MQFKHVLDEGQSVLDLHDTAITLKQFVDTLTATEGFKNEFLYPFMAAAWGVTTLNIELFAGYGVLKYFVTNQPKGLKPVYWNEIVGRTTRYIKALSESLPKTNIRLSTTITNISCKNHVYTISLGDGTESQFDYLAITSNASDAADLLRNIPEKEDICTILKQIKYYNTTTATHGHERFMPKNRSDWAVANIGYDGTHIAMTYTSLVRWSNSHFPQLDNLYSFISQQQ